jgi:hypothetical protein
MVISSSMSPQILRRVLHGLGTSNAAFTGSLVLNRCLDGTLRRKCFGNFVSVDRVLAAIPTLPWNSPEFVSGSVGSLLFSAVVSAMHASPETTDNARLLLDTALDTLGVTDSKCRDRLNVLMENSRVMDVVEVLSATKALAAAIGPPVEAEFMALLTEPVAAGNPGIWCVQAAAATQFKGGDYAAGLTFVERLPALLGSAFGYRQMALAFRALSELICKFPADTLIPVFLVWPPLLAAGHSNQMLRNSGLRLLKKVIPFAMANGGFRDLTGIQTTRYISQSLYTAVSLFETDMKVSFADNFAWAFIQTLGRAVEEITTRKRALSVLKLCIESERGRSRNAPYFALPLLAFGSGDPKAILASAGSRFQVVPEFLFDGFASRTSDEQSCILGYLGAMFGARLCVHRIDVLGNCLLFAAKRYPRCCGGLKRMIVKKCWTMIDSEVDNGRIDRLVQICGAFLSLPPGKAAWKPREPVRMSDDTLATYINGTLDGIADVLKLNLRSPQLE